MRSSVPLYDRLAPSYDEHFAAPHRRLYDHLAWDLVMDRLPSPVAAMPVVDAGCGVGRWAETLVEEGHRVVGIEQAPEMAAGARARNLGAGFSLVEESMESVDLPAGEALAVLAMGSLQYTADPVAQLSRFATWTMPGGLVAVLVDGRAALAVELGRDGKVDEAEERVRTRRGIWQMDGCAADLHLFDARGLEDAMAAAGLVDVVVHGLLCGWTIKGRERFFADLADDPVTWAAREAEWARDAGLADLGKQLLAIGRVPD